MAEELSKEESDRKMGKDVDRLINSFGGRDKMNAAIDAEHQALLKRWNQDTAMIGRILRAHLFVEHFLNEYVAFANPNLGSAEDARLSFAQKTSLISETSDVAYLLPGIRLLNKIRNRLAHNLEAAVTVEDSNAFLQILLFRAMREEGAKPAKPSTVPIDVLESFAQHAGMTMGARCSPYAKHFADSLNID